MTLDCYPLLLHPSLSASLYLSQVTFPVPVHNYRAPCAAFVLSLCRKLSGTGYSRQERIEFVSLWSLLSFIIQWLYFITLWEKLHLVKFVMGKLCFVLKVYFLYGVFRSKAKCISFFFSNTKYYDNSFCQTLLHMVNSIFSHGTNMQICASGARCLLQKLLSHWKNYLRGKHTCAFPNYHVMSYLFRQYCSTITGAMGSTDSLIKHDI